MGAARSHLSPTLGVLRLSHYATADAVPVAAAFAYGWYMEHACLASTAVAVLACHPTCARGYAAARSNVTSSPAPWAERAITGGGRFAADVKRNTPPSSDSWYCGSAPTTDPAAAVGAGRAVVGGGRTVGRTAADGGGCVLGTAGSACCRGAAAAAAAGSCGGARTALRRGGKLEVGPRPSWARRRIALGLGGTTRFIGGMPALVPCVGGSAAGAARPRTSSAEAAGCNCCRCCCRSACRCCCTAS